MKPISIALDGPAGAGKSTIAKMIAKITKLIYIDTGAMYRAITLVLMNNKISLGDEERLLAILHSTVISFEGEDILVNGVAVTNDIRKPEISHRVSNVAKIPAVRTKMVELQRQMASNIGVIMDGRDIGTNVLPNATYKFFLTASIEERAYRRYEELLSKGYTVSLDEVKLDMELRDKNDTERVLNPLRKAEDAIVIDTTDKTIEGVIGEIISYIQ